MKMKVLALLVFHMIALPLSAAEREAGCTLCIGAVLAAPVTTDQAVTSATAVPLMVRASDSDLTAASALLDSLSVEARRRVLLVLTVEMTDGGLTEAETRSRQIVDWAGAHGPVETIALDVRHNDLTIAAFMLKRIAVTAQGLNVASSFAIAATPVAKLAGLWDLGAQTYFDAVLTSGSDVAATAAWLAERDPSKKVLAIVQPEAPNPMYDAARALADGATRAFLEGPVSIPAVASINRSLAGDWAWDSTAKTTVLDAKGQPIEMAAVTFVRGEDLRTAIVPRGEATSALIVSLPSNQFKQPHRVDAAGERAITDVGQRGARLLVGLQPSAQPYLLYVNRSEKMDANVTRDTINVATQRGITVEEIIRNHQAYDAFQESIQPRYVARNTTKLRFYIANGGDAVEASISGDYFSDPAGRADWVWQDFHINGVRWKYGRIPELPLIQPEKVTQLPLDLHLSNEYRYELVRETDMLGHRTYEVRFEPPPNAPEALPLYRGTVWIDTRNWARIRISMIQLNLTGEVLSNEERIDFQPFAREGFAPLTAAEVATRDGRSVVWLPREVSAQQVVSAAGRANPIERATTFANFRINPADFDTSLAEIASSEARMVRETESGLRYLEKRGNGERVVKEGFDSSQLFMVGGIHHDAGLEFPVVPLGGIDYFNFNLFDRGIQTNVFFAGLMVAANATHPNVANTRINVGADFFGIAIPVTNTMYRSGEEQVSESVKQVPLVFTLRAGKPVLNFGKIDVSFTAAHLTYQRGEDTASDFTVPSDTFLFGPSLSTKYARRGWAASAFYDYTTRSSWEPWGNLAEFDEDQKTFTKFGASFGKSFFLPKFQRIGIDVNYLDGRNLDRFSKYELGFFGSQRVHGVRSGSVRAERAFIGHLSYGFVLSEQFRLEAFYDRAVLDDTTAGLRNASFQGLGIAGQTVGPYGTLLRLDIGKTFGKNSQDGFVANVVFLKLF